jgi:hypothetical protein
MLSGVSIASTAPATVHRSQTSASAVIRRPSTPPAAITLAAVPRPMEGETAALLHRLSYSSWQLMTASRDPDARPSAVDMATIAFFSVLTVGILPLIMWSVAHGRRRRLRQFLADGLPALATVLDMEKEVIAFDVKMTRVRYEFEADGRLRRDVDNVLPSIAARWDPGDAIHVLYLPGRDYESMIISTS